jgi:BCD family chlorophyll transporter-like MFS transporter
MAVQTTSGTSHSGQPQLPRLGVVTMLRLGVFQACLGAMSVLTLGVLNRVMIDELRIPALVTAGAIAMHQFVAPARVWFGQLSDARPWAGHHRTGYVWSGAVCFCLAAFLAVQVIWPLSASLASEGWSSASYGWTGLLAAIFAVYGIALSASSTPFAALLVDISDEDNRPRLVSIVWSMLTVGIVVGAILGSRVLPSETEAPLALVQASVNRLFSIVPLVVLTLIGLSTWGIERRFSRYRYRSHLVDREDSVSLGQALKILTASPQTGLFFAFLATFTLSLFMQEAVLEPYGGQIFGLSIAETTRLNAIWGVGTLVGISSTGFFVVPSLGKQRTAYLGCGLCSLSFVLLVLAGFTANPALLKAVLFFFGVSAGIATNGALNLMLDLTVAETAGTFIGAWGLAQAMSRAFATVMGGLVLDVGRRSLTLLTGAIAPTDRQLFPAYALVFLTQAAGMVGAIFLLRRVNVQDFRTKTQTAISDILQVEMD